MNLDDIAYVDAKTLESFMRDVFTCNNSVKLKYFGKFKYYDR